MTYIRYLRDDAYQILFYDLNFPKGEMCQLECFKRIITCWWVAWALNFSFGHNRHGHEGGTIDTVCVCVCVCVEGEGSLVPAKWEPCQFQHQYLQFGAPVYSLTLFSEGSGTGHHGGRHHSYIVGVWGHLVRGMGFLVLFRYRMNQIQVIDWTQGEAGLFQNHSVKGGTEAPL